VRRVSKIEMIGFEVVDKTFEVVDKTLCQFLISVPRSACGH